MAALLFAEHLIDGDEGEASGAEGVDDGGESFDRLADAVVQEKDAAGAGAVERALNDRIDAGAGVVPGIVGPEDGRVALRASGIQAEEVALAARWAEQVGALAGDLLEDIAAGSDLRGIVDRVDLDQADVMIGVVTDGVAGGYLGAHQLRIALGHLANDKERGRDVAFVQDIEQLIGVAGMRSIVEGQCDLFTGGIAALQDRGPRRRVTGGPEHGRLPQCRRGVSLIDSAPERVCIPRLFRLGLESSKGVRSSGTAGVAEGGCRHARQGEDSGSEGGKSAAFRETVWHR